MAEGETDRRNQEISTFINNDLTLNTFHCLDECNDMSLSYSQNETVENNKCNTNVANKDSREAMVVPETTTVNSNSEQLYKDLKMIRNANLKNVIISHLNINSLGPKINEIRELQGRCAFDVLVLSETKLDGSYKQEVLDIEGYCCIRQDKRSNSGGLLTYV